MRGHSYIFSNNKNGLKGGRIVMRRLLFIPAIIILIGNCIFAHNTFELSKAYQYLEAKGEVYFKCERPERLKIQEFTQVVSIDKVDGYEVFAYANKAEFDQFLQYGLEFQVLTHPGDILKNPAMTDYSDPESYEWDEYPTYSAYITMMRKFETDYPDKCKIVKIGESIENRELLFAVISDNVDTDEAEPRFMYSSTMHGDEVTGYVTLLRLIDYLLTKYDSDTYIKGLVDNIEIWIQPCENPDGTYYTSNTSVSGARRANARGVDLNRNYPNPERNITNQQKETLLMMDLFDEKQFVMGMNFHGGAELLNYAFDSWTSAQYQHADDPWFYYVCREFVNIVHDIDPNYMTGENNGVTQGGDWYIIFGSRMDYTTWFRHNREVTGELSYQKTPPARNLPSYWDKLYQSLLYYIEQCTYGIRGTIKEKTTGVSICHAKVYAKDHDKDSSFVYSDTPHGDFYRPALEGTYTLEFTHPDCQPETVEDIDVQNEQATVLEVEMECAAKNINQNVNKSHDIISIIPTSSGIKFNYDLKGTIKTEIFDLNGRLIKAFPINNTGSNYTIWNGKDNSGRKVSSGCYLAKFKVNNSTHTKPFIFSK
jgi:hypothetical protein